MKEIEELLEIAGELLNYSRTMPNDPYARRWYLAGMAMVSQANAMAGTSEAAGDPAKTAPKLTRSDFDIWFDAEFWPSYPPRFGTNPRKPASDKLVLKIKNGKKPEKVMAGVRRFRAECEQQRISGTKFVMQAVRWINGESWNDDPLPSNGGERTFADISADLIARAEENERNGNRSPDEFEF